MRHRRARVSAPAHTQPQWALNILARRVNVNLEYAPGIDDNRGVSLKLGYAW